MLGHPAVKCQLTDVQLRGPGGIEVTETELTAVEDLAKPFSGPVIKALQRAYSRDLMGFDGFSLTNYQS